ncbi:hypothetical protein ACWDR0_11365 [Streptomyces sp. NPDC003691]
MRRVSTGTAISVAVALLATGAGAAYTADAVGGADRTAPTVIWGGAPAEPGDDPAGDLDRGRSDTPLGRLLLPVPDTQTLGPDMTPYGGNDGEFDARQAERLMKDRGEGLTGAERRRFDRTVERAGLQGMAWRTYVENQVGLYLTEVQIARMKNKEDARGMHASYAGLKELLGVDKGPGIEGHREAACFQDLPEEPDSGYGLFRYDCSAHVAGVFVMVRFTGDGSLSAATVAGFVKKQLDHIASPGEYV